MKMIKFSDTVGPYVVSIVLESDQDMLEVTRFEIQRIQSLISRKIKIKTESRIWDQNRRITVGVKE